MPGVNLDVETVTNREHWAERKNLAGAKKFGQAKRRVTEKKPWRRFSRIPLPETLIPKFVMWRSEFALQNVPTP